MRSRTPGRPIAPVRVPYGSLCCCIIMPVLLLFVPSIVCSSVVKSLKGKTPVPLIIFADRKGIDGKIWCFDSINPDLQGYFDRFFIETARLCGPFHLIMELKRATAQSLIFPPTAQLPSFASTTSQRTSYNKTLKHRMCTAG